MNPKILVGGGTAAIAAAILAVIAFHPGPCDPARGHGVMGACTAKPSVVSRVVGASSSVSGGLISDVSSYQGHPDWGTAAHQLQGAIVKAAEANYGQDPDFAYNWQALKALHLWHTAYYFARPGDCNSQADSFVATVNAQGGFDSGPPVIDAEVPGVPAGCIASRVERDLGWNVVVIYTSPGTWPGGDHGNASLWVATYGSSPGCVWTCGHVAWQYTDGSVGPGPHCVSGIGCGDLSINTGITSLVRTPPPPPRVHCFGPHAQVRNSVCRRVRPEVARRSREIVRVRQLLVRYGCRKPNGQRGPNHDKYFCKPLFRIGTADHAFIDRNLY